MKYIRFVVGLEGENTLEQTGVFIESRLLLESGVLSDHETKLLKTMWWWFNENMPCPPFEENDWNDGVSWFRTDCDNNFISKLWAIINLLKEHNVPVRILKSNNPGKILYKDYCQVVASEW